MRKIYWLFIPVMFITGGCASSKITSSWKAPDTAIQKYNKILVLGLVREADRTIQQKMEEHLAGDLADLGFTAISSIKEFGPKAFDRMDEEAAINKLKGSGIDAVLTIVLLDKERERKYVPGNIYFSPFGFYQRRFWGYRATLYNRIYEPGYYVTNTKFFWESNLYDMSNQKLIYSAQTQSFDPQNSESLGHQYGLLIIQDMVKQNVLKKKGAATASNAAE